MAFQSLAPSLPEDWLIFAYIGLAKKFIRVFPQYHPNELFGQPNLWLL